MGKKARYADYAKGLERIFQKKKQNASPKSVLEKLKQLKNETARGGVMNG